MMNRYFTGAFVFFAVIASAQSGPLALVGGRLIDGFGGHPLANSVIIIDNERIKAIGTVGALQVPPDAEIISTEGMDVLPGLWDCHVHTMILGHSDYAYWDKTYPPRLGGEIMPAAARQLLMAGVTSARDLGGPLKESTGSIAVKFPALLFTSPVRSFSTSLILVPITSAGASKAQPMAKPK
jgi:imidazolonepropionase-like amidohydrolase